MSINLYLKLKNKKHLDDFEAVSEIIQNLQHLMIKNT